MVAPRQPPKFTRSPPPSSSSSPPPPSNLTAATQPMGRIVSLTKREGTTTTTTAATSKNTSPYSSSAPPSARPGLVRGNPPTAVGRQPPRRRPSPSPGSDAPAPTLKGSNQASAAGEAPSRPGFSLRRDALGVPPPQQPQGPGWRRRRAITTAEGSATIVDAAASSGSQEMPEAKRLQVDRGDKAEAGIGGVAPPKPAPQALTAAVASVETSPAVVEEQPSSKATARDEGKASAQLPSTDPSPAQQHQQQQDRVSDTSDLVTPSLEESDPQVSRAAVLALAVSDVGGKPVAIEDPMNVDPTAEDGAGSEQVTNVDSDDTHCSEFAALIKKHAELIRRSTLWIGGALQSIREDISKAAASDAGRAKLGELVRMSVTDFFEPAVERTRTIAETADTLAEEVERYSRGEGKSENELLA